LKDVRHFIVCFSFMELLCKSTVPSHIYNDIQSSDTFVSPDGTMSYILHFSDITLREVLLSIKCIWYTI